LTVRKKPVIYTFDDGTKGVEAMIRVWNRKWEDAGWDPVVLTMENAKSHPSYSSVKEILPQGSIGDRTMHWLAMAQAGGGWFSECDVFPLRDFTQDTFPSDGALTLWENVVPSLISGSSSEYERGALMLAGSMHGASVHSDILALVELSRSNPFDKHFLKERKVAPGTAALDRNITSCFEGKRAVHFTTSFLLDEIKAIELWLDAWSASNCSDLPKPKTVVVETIMKSTEQPDESSLSSTSHEQKQDTVIVQKTVAGTSLKGEIKRRGALEIPKHTQGYVTNSEFRQGLMESTTTAVTSKTNDFSQGISQEENGRLLRMHLLPQLPQRGFEWNELVRAATIDETIVHQLAMGPRRVGTMKIEPSTEVVEKGKHIDERDLRPSTAN
jgi:hypothetical protein